MSNAGSGGSLCGVGFDVEVHFAVVAEGLQTWKKGGWAMKKEIHGKGKKFSLEELARFTARRATKSNKIDFIFGEMI